MSRNSPSEYFVLNNQNPSLRPFCSFPTSRLITSACVLRHLPAQALALSQTSAWTRPRRLTFDHDVPGQLGAHAAGVGLELQIAPGQQAALQGPEQGEEHCPAGSSAHSPHHHLALTHTHTHTESRGLTTSQCNRKKFANRNC